MKPTKVHCLRKGHATLIPSSDGMDIEHFKSELQKLVDDGWVQSTLTQQEIVAFVVMSVTEEHEE